VEAVEDVDVDVGVVVDDPEVLKDDVLEDPIETELLEDAVLEVDVGAELEEVEEEVVFEGVYFWES
jgi:hypothetical protein